MASTLPLEYNTKLFWSACEWFTEPNGLLLKKIEVRMRSLIALCMAAQPTTGK